MNSKGRISELEDRPIEASKIKMQRKYIYNIYHIYFYIYLIHLRYIMFKLQKTKDKH